MSWVWVIGALFVCLIIAFVCHRLFHWRRVVRPTIHLDQLKTGDIVYSTPMGLTRSIFNIGGVQGTHAMMALRDDDGEVFLYHITGYHDDPIGNRKPHFTLARERLDDYKDDAHFSVFPYLGAPISTERFLNQVHANLKDYEFTTGFIGNYLKWVLLGIPNKERKKVCCGDLIYLCLVQLGIVPYRVDHWSDAMRFCQSSTPEMVPYQGLKGTYGPPHDLVV